MVAQVSQALALVVGNINGHRVSFLNQIVHTQVNIWTLKIISTKVKYQLSPLIGAKFHRVRQNLTYDSIHAHLYLRVRNFNIITLDTTKRENGMNRNLLPVNGHTRHMLKISI